MDTTRLQEALTAVQIARPTDDVTAGAGPRLPDAIPKAPPSLVAGKGAQK